MGPGAGARVGPGHQASPVTELSLLGAFQGIGPQLGDAEDRVREAAAAQRLPNELSSLTRQIPFDPAVLEDAAQDVLKDLLCASPRGVKPTDLPINQAGRDFRALRSGTLASTFSTARAGSPHCLQEISAIRTRRRTTFWGPKTFSTSLRRHDRSCTTRSFRMSRRTSNRKRGTVLHDARGELRGIAEGSGPSTMSRRASDPSPPAVDVPRQETGCTNDTSGRWRRSLMPSRTSPIMERCLPSGGRGYRQLCNGSTCADSRNGEPVDVGGTEPEGIVGYGRRLAVGYSSPRTSILR